MSRSLPHRIGAAGGVVVLALVALGALREPAPVSWPLSCCAYAMLMLAPGFALYLVVERERTWLEGLTSALVASPVLVALVAVPAMVLGAHVAAPDGALIILAAVVTALALARGAALGGGMSRRHLAILGVFVVLLCVIIAYLPMTREWWRIRSDAWAHRAYIAEIADFGVPPQDPYFLGFPLEYMWAYHVLVLAVSEATHVDPFRVMAFVNVQALAGLVLATYLFASALVEGFARRMMSVVTVIFGLNAGFWLFLPVLALGALRGETRGWAELTRQYSLTPFTYNQAVRFMTIFHNKAFFLDKFMVGTAFGLGLCLMAATWYAATAYLQRRRRFLLVFLFIATLGMLAFHTLVGSVMLVGVFGGLALLFLTRKRVDGYRISDSMKVAGTMLAALAVTAPYVLSVVAAKDSVGQSSPRLLVARVIGIAIASGVVLVLAALQRRFFRTRSPVPRFVLFASAAVLVYALLVPLPGPNSYDKPVFFIFFPAAVVGAWSLVDLERARGRALAVVVAALAFLPGNALALAACFHTPPDWTLTTDERDVSTWLADHTPRDAVLLENDDRVLYVTTVPRRHYWGRIGFASQWGYDRVEMSRRYHAWRVLYSDRPLDSNTLGALGSVDRELFAVWRHDNAGPDPNVDRYPDYFAPVYERGSITVFRVDTARCRADAASGRFPTVPEEDILRESGLQ